MPFITSEQIRDMSTKTVEGFLNNKVPLSEGLAKQASYHNLNSEQVQRAVEATNSIAYLKVLSLADDRTVEFPLCKYAEVIQNLALPKDLFTKQASVIQMGRTPGKTVALPYEDFVKAASFNDTTLTEMNEVETQIYLTKLASKHQRELEHLKEKEMFMAPDLIKAAKDFSKDSMGLEKLATVAKGSDYAKLSTLVYGVAKPFEDTGLFKEADLKEARNLAGMLKQAEELVANIQEKEKLLKAAALQKEAFLGMIGRGIGRAIGAVASAPVKMVGGTIGKAAYNAGQSAKSMGASAANSVRGAVGLTPKPMPVINKKKIAGVGMLGLGATMALDSTMYNAGTDSTTGRSKNVWDSLQKEPS